MVKKKSRYIQTDIWDMPWFATLSLNAKLLYLYLLTNPRTNLSGVYQIMDDRIKFDCKLKKLGEVMKELQDCREIVRSREWLIVLRYPEFQQWHDKPTIGRCIQNEIDSLPADIRELLRESEYRYAPIKNDEAFEQERQRIDQAFKNRTASQEEKRLGEITSSGHPEKPPAYKKPEPFNEDVPWGTN